MIPYSLGGLASLHRTLLAVVVGCPLALEAAGTQILAQSLEEVVLRSESVVVAKLARVSPVETHLWSRSIEIEAAPLQVLYGSKAPANRVRGRYLEGLPHFRNGAAISPLVTGSGREFEVREGEQVILLIGEGEGDPGGVLILRMEPASSLEGIRRLLKAR